MLAAELPESSLQDPVVDPEVCAPKTVECRLEVKEPLLRGALEHADRTGDVQLASPGRAATMLLIDEQEVSAELTCQSDCLALPGMEVWNRLNGNRRSDDDPWRRGVDKAAHGCRPLGSLEFFDDSGGNDDLLEERGQNAYALDVDERQER